MGCVGVGVHTCMHVAHFLCMISGPYQPTHENQDLFWLLILVTQVMKAMVMGLGNPEQPTTPRQVVAEAVTRTVIYHR